jgi:hypothetical protein
VPTTADTDLVAEILNGAIQSTSSLEKMGFSVQIGAFNQLNNAVQLEQSLTRRGVDAYYFRHESGLYKVRFGNHTSYQKARSEGEQLQKQVIIGRFLLLFRKTTRPQEFNGVGRGIYAPNWFQPYEDLLAFPTAGVVKIEKMALIAVV